MSEYIVELSDVTKQYPTHTAVNNLSLRINKGEVFGLLGPNGAGKSTTILMMLGLTEPTSGTVRVCGFDSTRNPIEVKRRTGYLPEDVGFYEDYTGLENLVYTARLNGLSRAVAQKKAQELLVRVGLTDVMNKKAGKYSRGMRQRLGLADVLIKSPEIIILDEPTLGIDPKGVEELLSLIGKLSEEEGLTVLLSSHHLHQVQKICDRVGLFVNGKLIAEGNMDTLSRDLFDTAPYLIEAGVVVTTPNQAERIQQAIQENLDGVVSVNRREAVFEVACLRDAATDVARLIVEGGGGLNYLQRKAYGLDDIYNHYFKEKD